MSSSAARREVGARLGARAGRHELVAAAAAAAVAVAAAAEELDAVGDDLDGLALAAAVLRLPLTPVEAAVDRDGATLREVLRAALRLIAEDGDAEVVRLVDPLARLVLPPAVHGQTQAAHGGAARRVPELGVAGQVPDEHDPVDAGCHSATPPRPNSCLARRPRRPRLQRAPAPAPARLRRRGRALLDRCGDGAACGAGSSSRGALVREPSTCLVAMWRSTPSSILRTREISSSVSALALEHDEVVDALRLLRDLVREAPAAPRVMAAPRAAALLDEVAHARDQVVLVGLGALRVQHQKNLVRRHSPEHLRSFPWSESAPTACAARDGTAR